MEPKYAYPTPIYVVLALGIFVVGGVFGASMSDRRTAEIQSQKTPDAYELLSAKELNDRAQLEFLQQRNDQLALENVKLMDAQHLAYSHHAKIPLLNTH